MKTKRRARSISRRTARRGVKHNGRVESRYSLADLNREFPDDDACLEYIKEQLWPNGVTRCEQCGVERKHHRVNGRTAFACDYCGNHVYPLRETLFARSSTRLTTWFYVIYLLAFAESRITAKRIQRETGVTYKTAWRALSLLRPLTANGQTQSAPATQPIDLSKILNIQQNRDLAASPQTQREVSAGAA